MRTITWRAIIVLIMFIGTLFGFASYQRVFAQACTGWECEFRTVNGNTSQYCYGTPTGCVSAGGCSSQGCAGVSCEAGFYACNNGCCPIGGGGGQCGDTYPCGTPSNPDKICYISCGGGGAAACRSGKTDCPAGTVINLNQVISQSCEVVNSERQCGGIGSAQRTDGSQGACCRWVQPPRECGDWYPCGTRNNPDKMCRDCTEEPAYCANARLTTYGCVSTCNATAPTNVSVTQGSSPTVANLSWTSGINGVSQRLWVDEDLSEVNAGCPTPNDCVVNTSITPFTANTAYTYPPITGLLPNTTYYFRVVTYKDATCSPGTVVSYTTPASDTITGNVYLDTNNTCSTATLLTTGGMTATIRGTAYSGAVTNGTFSFAAGTETSYSNLDLSGIPAGYSCSTAPGCNYCLTLSPATSGSANNFFLTPQREPWWQVVGASIYSGATGGGNTVRSELPSSSTPLIAPGAGGAIGALLRASGTVDTGAGSVSDLGYSTLARYRGKIMNYEYFVAHMGVLSSTPQLTNLDSEPTPGAEFYYKSGDSVVEGSGVWDVTPGESYVIFVNGDLRIAKNMTVDDGGFLAFIVSGDITIDPSVTNIEGLYLMNGNFVTESSGSGDIQLDVAGSVVAWGGVSLGRDLDTTNLTEPAEQFSYRPDLLVNMPEAMKVFALRWQEVVPGTFSNQ